MPGPWDKYAKQPDQQSAASGPWTKYASQDATATPDATADASTQTPATPGFFKRAWDEINTPIGSHLPGYEAETEALNKAQNFSDTAEGRKAFEEHPIATGAKAVAAGIERDAASLATPAFVATSLAGPISEAVEAAVPEIQSLLSKVGTVARAAATGTFGAQGARQVIHAVQDTSAPIEQRVQEGLGGAAALTGVAAETGAAAKKVQTPGALRRMAQETFGAGEDFQKGVVDKYGKEAESTRTTNAKRQQLNEDRKVAHAKAVEKATESNRKTVAGYGESAAAHQTAVDKAAADHADALAEHQKSIQQAADTERIRQQTADEHQQLSGEFEQDVNTAKEEAQADNTEKWNAVRAKTKDAREDISGIQETAKHAQKLADPATSSLFSSIIGDDAATGTTDEQGRPIVGGAVRKVMSGGREFPPSDPHYADMYEALYGEPLPIQGADGQGATFDRLQRWYGFVNNKLYGGGRLEGGTYQALKMVRNSLNEAMGNLAEKTGATKDLQKARESHTQLMETFSDSPNEPQTNASTALRETTGEYQKEQARQKRLGMLGRYNESLPAKAERIRSLQRTLSELPSQQQTATTNKPEPEAPDLKAKPKMGQLKEAPTQKRELEMKAEPEAPVIQHEIREKLEGNLKKYGKVGVGIMRLVLGAGAVGAGHGGVGSMAERLIIGQGAMSVLSHALRSDSVMEWLSREPAPETQKAIDALPPQDAAKLRQAITSLAIEDAKSGKGSKVSSASARFLGPDNLALINTAVTAGRPKSAGDAKKRISDLRAGQQ